VNVTLVPAHTVLPWLDAMETVGATVLFTVMRITLLLATAGALHGSEEAISQLTTSLLFKAEVTYVALFVPTGEPFTNHW
jgi:hypothetical protein